MHLRAMSPELLPWQSEVERSLFQFLLLDTSLRKRIFKRICIRISFLLDISVTVESNEL